jgi:hypothetical protein
MVRDTTHDWGCAQHCSGFFNASTAARVALALADNSAWNTSMLGYHQPGFVDFRLPDLLPLGGVTNVVVYDASGMPLTLRSSLCPFRLARKSEFENAEFVYYFQPVD